MNRVPSGSGKGYRLCVMPNPGFDPEKPAAEWPWVVFGRCLGNPLASVWEFTRDKAAAMALSERLAEALIEWDKPGQDEAWKEAQ